MILLTNDFKIDSSLHNSQVRKDITIVLHLKAADIVEKFNQSQVI